MRKVLVNSTALALVGFMGSWAQAAELKQGPYVSLFGGVNWLDDDKDEFCTAGDSCETYDASWQLGAVVGGALGYRTAPIGPGHVRAEVEVAYRHNTEDKVTFSETPCTVSETGGCQFLAMSALSVMGNLWYDLPIGSSWSVFAGGGIGGARVTGRNLGFFFNEAAAEQAGNFPDDSDLVFAYQAGAGVTYTVPIGAELTLEYRYFGTNGLEFDQSELIAFESSFADHVHAGYTSQSVMLKLQIPLN